MSDSGRSSATRARAALLTAAAAVAVLLVSTLPPPHHILSRRNSGDITEYFRYTQQTFAGQVPYSDFSLEYPPGALLPMLAAGPANAGYYDRFRILMLCLGVAAILLLGRALFLAGATTAELAAGVLLLATLPLTLNPGLVLERFDLWPTALTLLAVVALLRGRHALAFSALGVGAAAKLFPLALLPLALLARRSRAHIRRDLAVFAAAALVLVLPFALLAPRGVWHVVSLLVRRPLHVESLGGSILLAAHRLGAYEPTVFLSFGKSWDLAGPAARAVAVGGSLVEAAALIVVWFLFARGPREHRDLLLAVAAAVVGFVAFGKILSPQYLVWIAAAVPLALGRSRPFVLTGAVTAALLTLYIYDYGYYELLAGGRVSWMLLVRNLILVAVFGALVAELAARCRAHPVAVVREDEKGGSAAP